MTASRQPPAPDSDLESTPRPAMPRALLVMRGPFLGKIIEIPDAGMIIGRSDECDLIVGTARDGTSRRHARVYQKNGTMRIKDLGSTNGLFLNGRGCRRGKLKTGDRIEIGHTLIKALSDVDEIEFHSKLYDMAIHDPLTGLFNRSHLREAAPSKSKARMSAILFDIDSFKTINDTHGHPAGNTVLLEVARLIRGSMPETVLSFRYGGDEFLILLPGTTIEYAVVMAERFRRKVEAHDFRHAGTSIPVTVSIGVAETDGVGKRLEGLILAADEALYTAKDDGRNRVRHGTGDDRNQTRRLAPFAV